MRIVIISFITLLIGLTSGWYIRGHYGNRLVFDSIGVDHSEAFIEQKWSTSSENYDSVLHPGFDQLKNNRNIDEIREAYLSLLDSKDDNKIQAAHLFLSNEIRQAINLKDVAYAESLIDLLLNENHRDIKALQLKARLRSQTGRYMQALEALYEAKGYAFSAEDITEITSVIRTLAEEYDEKLKQSGNNYKLLELYIYLTRMEPDYSPYFIKLASMQLLNDDKMSARRSLNLVSQDPFVGSQAQIMLSELEPKRLAQDRETNHVEEIPLQRRSEHFVVTAFSNDYLQTSLLIDTGASLTIFTPEMFSKLQNDKTDPVRTVLFNTANGTVRAPVYQIDSLGIGDWVVNDIDIGVMEISGANNIDGLLGMNYLQHFQFFIDQKSAMLRLSK